MRRGNNHGTFTPTGTVAHEMTLASAVQLETLFREYRGAAFALAYRMTGERGLAEDAVQEAFLAIWQHGSVCDPERGLPRTWFLTIVHHRAVDLLRRRRAKSGGDTAIDAALPVAAAEDTWGAVAETLERERVRRAIATLPPEQREAVHLAYFGGLTHAEIAARVGVPLGTVKGRLRLATEKLRHALAPPATGGEEAIRAAA